MLAWFKLNLMRNSWQDFRFSQAADRLVHRIIRPQNTVFFQVLEDRPDERRSRPHAIVYKLRIIV